MEDAINPMPPTNQARWFSAHVQPYEPALRAYLQKRFPALPDHDDLVQETYIRTLRAYEGGRVTHAKVFLFTTARNAAIDLFRRRRGLAHESISEITALRVLDETSSASETLEQERRLEFLLEAIRALPERCRQVMMLRHLDGLACKEIAERRARSRHRRVRRQPQAAQRRGRIRFQFPTRQKT